MSDKDIEQEKLDLERERLELAREKFASESAFAERRLKIEENDQARRDRELRISESEHRRSQWRNPLVVAILAATIAAAGNAVVAIANGMLQRKLEDRKAESVRILEMIKTDGDADKAAENLGFLLKAGLVDDSSRQEKLEQFLADREPGSGPSLPSGGPAADPVVSVPGEFNFRIPTHPRIVTEVILTDTDTTSLEVEVRGLRAHRVSYHYLVDESGVVHSLVPEEFIAFHVSGRNTASIGIGILHELGTGYPEEQLEALKALLAGIGGRHRVDGANLLTRRDVQPERRQDIPVKLPELRAAIEGE